MSKMTKAAVLERVKGLDADAAKAAICALVGHSLIATTCFGYYNCARCGTQIGDTLASAFPDVTETVVVGHNCAKCRENFAKLDWRHKLMTPDPFKAEAA